MRSAIIPGNVGFPVGVACGFVVTVLGALLGHPWWALIALAAVVLAVSALTTAPAALGTAAICWCLHTGFILNRFGELALSPSADRAAAVLFAAALLSTTLAALTRIALYRTRTLPIPTQRTAPPSGATVPASAFFHSRPTH